MLLVTRYLLPDTCYLTHVTGTCYLVYSPAICYLILVKPDTSYLILASRYIFSDNLYLIPLTVYLLPNTYNLILVTWYLLPIACYPNFLPTTFLPSSVPVQSSSVQFELRLSLKPGYYHPHPPPTHPPGKVEMQTEIDPIYGQWVAGG